MKYDPMCATCSKECKQPAAAKLVSCPQYKKANSNLEMFDMKGNVRKELAVRLKTAKKNKQPEEG